MLPRRCVIGTVLLALLIGDIADPSAGERRLRRLQEREAADQMSRRDAHAAAVERSERLGLNELNRAARSQITDSVRSARVLKETGDRSG